MGEYEDVLYDDYAFVEAHPARLFALGQLFGIRPPDGPIRVLDLGCGLGGHLMPLAEQDPRGHYVGLDLSAPQIAQGQATAKALGLGNVELRVADLREPPDDLGSFDLIVCHGVYSWIPRQARIGIWRILERCLTPGGLGYVSFNTYPGWRHRGTVRDVLQRLVPAAGQATDRERIDAARDVLSAWKGTLEGRESHHLAALHGELQLLEQTTDAYLLYEHLASINQPSWFGEILEDATTAGLGYLGDAVMSSMFPQLGEQADAWISERASSLETREQVTDLFTQRLFRRSVFARAHVPIDRELHWRRLKGLWLCGRLAPKEEAPETFVSPIGTAVTVDDPMLRTAVGYLIERSPAGVPFETVCSDVLGEQAETRDRARLGTALLELATQDLIELRTHFPAIASELPERPRALPLARLQAARGEPGAVNLRHERVKLGQTDKAILARLDGQHTRADLLEALRAEATDGDVEVRIDGELTTEPGALEAALELVLDRLRRGAFLVAEQG